MTATAITAPTCYCGSEMRQRNSRFGRFWGCVRYPHCDGKVGTHPDGSPVGTPAPPEVRKARIKAHAVFDPLWLNGGLTRAEAYQLLAAHFGKTEVHIGHMGVEECERVVQFCVEFEVDRGRGGDAQDRETIRLLVGAGHTDHCAKRMVFGDGECECRKGTEKR